MHQILYQFVMVLVHIQNLRLRIRHHLLVVVCVTLEHIFKKGVSVDKATSQLLSELRHMLAPDRCIVANLVKKARHEFELPGNASIP